MSSAPDELLPLGRLEAFSDGVFAIAITLLVLELGVASDAGEHLLRSILHEWPSLLAYITSFLTIGVVWPQASGNSSGDAPRRGPLAIVSRQGSGGNPLKKRLRDRETRPKDSVRLPRLAPRFTFAGPSA